MPSNIRGTDNFDSGYMLGVGQTWQNVKSQRASGTQYINNTGKPIQVNIAAATSANQNVRVDGVIIGYTTNNSISTPFNFIVPAGSTYQFSDTTATTISYWAELR